MGIVDGIGYRIDRLLSATRTPISVRPDDSLERGITIMLANDFSQLPVMTSTRDVNGVLSWKSIGRRIALGQAVRNVRDCMDQHYEVSIDTSLFSAMGLILKYEFVLVRNSEGVICGIVTTTDLGNQFREQSEPYLLLGQIEKHIRILLAHKFSAEEIGAVRNTADSNRPNVDDLTFGEYLRLLGKASNWEKMQLHIDRGAFIEALDRVRKIRNDVMHFDPTPLSRVDLESLRAFEQFSKYLVQLQMALVGIEAQAKLMPLIATSAK